MMMAYLALFAIAFLAATLFPAQSELALAGMLASGRYDPWLLLLVATVGNVLGSVVNWMIGRYLTRYRDRRWFPIRGKSLARAEAVYRRWGVWTLLLSWLPIVGDPLTVLAGVLRTPMKLFLPRVLVAKAGRYLAVSGLVQLL